MTNLPAGFGLTIPQRGVEFGLLTPQQLLSMGAAADETTSLDSIWVGDSLTAKPRLEAVALLGGLAAVTNRVVLGVGCMSSFPVRDPLVFAYQWGSLDVMSAGRTLLAVCTGIGGEVSEDEGRHWGLKENKERAPRMAENIEICRRLWTGEEASFEGKYTSFERLQLQPKPVQDPCPIWITANPGPRFAEQALRRVAKLADGWMGANLMPGMFENQWGMLRGYLDEAGQDPGSFPTFAYHNLHVNDDREQALEESQRFLNAYYGPIFSPEMVEAWTAAGSVNECAEALRRLVDGGAKGITVRLTSYDQEGQFKRYVEEVLPALAEAPVAS